MSFCCEEFAKATKAGTNYDGYLALIFIYDDGRFLAGDGLKELSFCPWCGKALEGPAKPAAQ